MMGREQGGVNIEDKILNDPTGYITVPQKAIFSSPSNNYLNQINIIQTSKDISYILMGYIQYCM